MSEDPQQFNAPSPYFNYSVERLVRSTFSRAPAGGLIRPSGTLTIHVISGDESPCSPIVVLSVPADATPRVTKENRRAAMINVQPGDGPVALESITPLDDEKPPPGVKPTNRFIRASARLAAAMGKANGLTAPSFCLSRFQPARPLSFGGGPPKPERPLVAAALAASRNEAARVFRHYTPAVNEAIDLASYTTHDPDTLHPRFLEYVHERTTTIHDPPTRESVSVACDAMRIIWRESGVAARALPMSAVTAPTLVGLMNDGSSGEYRALGATRRLDPRLVPTLVSSLERYASAAAVVAAGGPPAKWLEYTDQPVITFGKKEPKSAKRGPDGNVIPPVPRMIFNMSPVNYTLAAFLHHDVSVSLQDNDPTHGPGFGPGRGRHTKFTKIVESALSGTTTRDAMVMSDIEKWDANMPEVLLGISFDLLEGLVDKSHLSKRDKISRAMMVGVARRQLMEKLVEHPSGYLVTLFGCMPSGSYYTSLLNTIANNVLALSYCASAALSAGKEVGAQALADAARGCLVSYGDNQLINTRMFRKVGVEYEAEGHARHLAKFGMRLKVSETEVTNKVSRVRFCSRAVVRTPHGILITRTHTSVLAKLAARPGEDDVANKLYVRALMVDCLGTDPILFSMLEKTDKSILVDISTQSLTDKVRDILESVVMGLYGNKSDASFLGALSLMTTRLVSRRALLSLHTARDDKPAGLGDAFTLATSDFRGPLTPAANWALSQSPAQFAEYLRETGQEGILTD